MKRITNHDIDNAISRINSALLETGTRDIMHWEYIDGVYCLLATECGDQWLTCPRSRKQFMYELDAVTVGIAIVEELR